MGRIRHITVVVLLLLLAGASAYALDSDLSQRFEAAVQRRDFNGMRTIVEKNLDQVLDEIEALVKEALMPDTSKEDYEGNFYVAERMASVYKDVTGDIEPLKNVKRKFFESKLHSPVESTPKDGVHIVEALSTEKVKNIFRPDNIIIKKGETVRWVNNDTVGHVIGSVPLIGITGIFSPEIQPGDQWEYTFNKPGEYYYICFIHRVMYGKITVTE